jgi:hypothetical protein
MSVKITPTNIKTTRSEQQNGSKKYSEEMTVRSILFDQYQSETLTPNRISPSLLETSELSSAYPRLTPTSKSKWHPISTVSVLCIF